MSIRPSQNHHVTTCDTTWLDETRSPMPIGMNATPIRKNVGNTVPTVRIGDQDGSFCCLKALPVKGTKAQGQPNESIIAVISGSICLTLDRMSGRLKSYISYCIKCLLEGFWLFWWSPIATTLLAIGSDLVLIVSHKRRLESNSL